jgi:ABC-type phosphate transport system substrate-binding protein
MKILYVKKFIYIVGFAASLCWAGDYAVIVNPANSITSMSKGELKRVFTGKMKQVGGNKAVPVNMNYDTPTAKIFISDVTGNDVAKYKKFWVDQMIKGKGTAPMIKGNIPGVKAIVSQIPGAIGYIPVADVDATVKKIDVN